MNSESNTITSQLEGFLESAKRLEVELEAERKKNQKIAQDYLHTRSTLENAVRQLQTQIKSKNQEIHSLNQSLQGAKANEERITARAKLLRTEGKKIFDELNQYKSAWSSVLARESAANNAINESEKMKNEMALNRRTVEHARAQYAEVAKRCQAAERNLQLTQQEMQNLHAKYNALSRDYQALNHQKRQSDEEIQRLNRAESSRVQELNLALEQAKFERNDLAQKLTHAEQAAELTQNKAKAQIVSLNEQLVALKRSTNEEIERRESIIAKLSEKSEKADSQNTATQNAIVELRSRIEEQDKIILLLRLEKQQAHTQAEQTRKTLNKNLLIERLKHETEIQALKAQIENLARIDVIVQKVEGEAPEAVVLVAEPVNPPAMQRKATIPTIAAEEISERLR